MTPTALATAFLWAVLLKLWDFSPVLAPTIVIYLIDAPISLKVLIGAQHAPKFPDDVESPNRKGILAKLRTMHPPWVADIEWALLLFFLLIALGVDVFVGDSTRKNYILYGILVLPGTCSFSRLPWRPSNLLVTRTIKAPVFVQVKEENSTIVNSLQLLSGWGICSAALLWGSNMVVARLCTSILYASFLNIFMLASTNAKHRSFWLRFIVGIVGFEAICIMRLAFQNANHGLTTVESESPDSTPKSNKSLSVPISVELFMSLVFSNLCFELVAFCYRMDYAFALQSGGVKAVPKFRGPEGTSPDKKFHAVRVLASFRPVFDKPYYKASIAGIVCLAITYTSFAVCLDADGHLLRGPLYASVGYILNTLGSPIIFFVLALAFWRGEVKNVWGYKEQWMDGPESAPFIGTEDDSSASTPELEFCDSEDLKGKNPEDEKYEFA